MKRLRNTAIGILVGLSVAPVGAAERRLAVMPTLVDQNASAEVPDIIDEYVLAAVQEACDYQVIGQEDLNAVLGFERQKELAGCEESTCFAEIGGALGVQKLVVVKVARVNRSWATSAKLILLGGEPRVENRVTRFVEGDTTALLRAVPELARSLLSGQQTTEPTTPATQQLTSRDTEVTSQAAPAEFGPGTQIPLHLHANAGYGWRQGDLGSGSGFALRAGVTYRLSRVLDADVGIGYMRLGLNSLDSNIIPLHIGARIHTNVRGLVEPWAVLRLGLGLVSTSFSGDPIASSSGARTQSDLRITQDAAGLRPFVEVAGGVNVAVTQMLSVGASLSYWATFFAPTIRVVTPLIGLRILL